MEVPLPLARPPMIVAKVRVLPGKGRPIQEVAEVVGRGEARDRQGHQDLREVATSKE